MIKCKICGGTKLGILLRFKFCLNDGQKDKKNDGQRETKIKVERTSSWLKEIK